MFAGINVEMFLISPLVYYPSRFLAFYTLLKLGQIQHMKKQIHLIENTSVTGSESTPKAHSHLLSYLQIAWHYKILDHTL